MFYRVHSLLHKVSKKITGEEKVDNNDNDA